MTQYGKGRLQLSPAQIKQLETSDTIKIPRKQFEDVSSPLPPKSPVEWIEPLDAVHWLAARIGGDVAAKTAIAERLRDGAVDCSHIWMSKGPDIGRVTSDRPKFAVLKSGVTPSPWVSPIRDGKNPAKIGNAFWLYSDDWDADLKRWNWSTGLFVVSRYDTSIISVDGIPTEEFKSEVRSRMVASGVRLSRTDIERIAEGAGGQIEGKAQKVDSRGTGKRGRKGPRLKKFNYGPVLASLQSEIISGKILRFGDPFRRGTMAAMEREIVLKLTDDDGLEPSPSTVRRRARELLEMWQQSR